MVPRPEEATRPASNRMLPRPCNPDESAIPPELTAPLSPDRSFRLTRSPAAQSGGRTSAASPASAASQDSERPTPPPAAPKTSATRERTLAGIRTEERTAVAHIFDAVQSGPPAIPRRPTESARAAAASLPSEGALPTDAPFTPEPRAVRQFFDENFSNPPDIPSPLETNTVRQLFVNERRPGASDIPRTTAADFDESESSLSSSSASPTTAAVEMYERAPFQRAVSILDAADSVVEPSPGAVTRLLESLPDDEETEDADASRRAGPFRLSEGWGGPVPVGATRPQAPAFPVASRSVATAFHTGLRPRAVTFPPTGSEVFQRPVRPASRMRARQSVHGPPRPSPAVTGSPVTPESGVVTTPLRPTGSAEAAFALLRASFASPMTTSTTSTPASASTPASESTPASDQSPPSMPFGARSGPTGRPSVTAAVQANRVAAAAANRAEAASSLTALRAAAAAERVRLQADEVTEAVRRLRVAPNNASDNGRFGVAYVASSDDEGEGGEEEASSATWFDLYGDPEARLTVDDIRPPRGSTNAVQTEEPSPAELNEQRGGSNVVCVDSRPVGTVREQRSAPEPSRRPHVRGDAFQAGPPLLAPPPPAEATPAGIDGSTVLYPALERLASASSTLASRERALLSNIEGLMRGDDTLDVFVKAGRVRASILVGVQVRAEQSKKWAAELSRAEQRVRELKNACEKPKKKEAMCVVCLEKMKKGDLVMTLPCFHTFHVACIRPHLKKSRFPCCPIDRTPVARGDIDALPVFEWGD